MELDLDAVGKFVGLGHTFASHAPDPVEWPVLWLEPAETVIAEGETVEVTPEVEQVGIGPELTAVIGERLWRPDEAEAASAVAGFTVSNDVSAVGRWPGHPNETTVNRAYKMFPTFRPVLTEATTDVSPEEANDLHVEASIDGEQVADASTSEMRWSVAEMIVEVATVMPLNEGDMVALGEPHAGEPFEPAAEVTCRIAGVGELTNELVRVEG